MANQMTKAQFMAAVADKAGCDRKVAAAVMEAVAGVVAAEVAAGGAVTLPGIGKIYARERAERMVRNPATGDMVHRAADRQVKVSLAKALKEIGAE